MGDGYVPRDDGQEAVDGPDCPGCRGCDPEDQVEKDQQSGPASAVMLSH